MPTLCLNLSKTEIDNLRYEAYSYPCPMVQKRLLSVLIKAQLQCSNEQVSQVTGLCPNSVSYWIHIYEAKGITGLLSNNYGTNKSDLENHCDSILSSFADRPPRSASEASLRIEEMTGVRRSEQQVRAFMKRHGLKFLKCGHIPAKADSNAQRHWVSTELEPAIEAAKAGKIHLLFMDAAHFVLCPFLCCLWCAVRVFIKASSGRNRINVLGAVHAITKEVVTLSNTTYITADTIVAFLKQLKERFSDKPIAIVLDNARYQHCMVVKTIAAGMGIHLLYLPAYSPNLNIIERLWKFTKKQILYARYYERPKDFHKAITDFFDTINLRYQQQLQSLITLKFQFFDNANPLFYPL